MVAQLAHSIGRRLYCALVVGIPFFVGFVLPMMVFPYDTSQLHVGYNLGPLISLTRSLSAFAIPLGLARLYAGAYPQQAPGHVEYSSCYTEQQNCCNVWLF